MQQVFDQYCFFLLRSQKQYATINGVGALSVLKYMGSSEFGCSQVLELIYTAFNLIDVVRRL